MADARLGLASCSIWFSRPSFHLKQGDEGLIQQRGQWVSLFNPTFEFHRKGRDRADPTRTLPDADEYMACTGAKAGPMTPH